MAVKVQFTKMHGAGNDYIYVDTTLYRIPNPARAAAVWSDRHKGIGSDGLVLIGRSPVPEADFTMRIFNADGSEAMMCGNASRCIGKYLYERGLTCQTRIRLLTLSGVKSLELHFEELSKDAAAASVPRIVSSVTVDMLEPQLRNVSQYAGAEGGVVDGTAEALDREFRGTFVSMGNPHFVIFVDNIHRTDVARYGAALELNHLFPQRCNIEFAQVMDSGDIRTRVWERGSGITQACGTGACATAVAAALTKRAGRKSRIVMDGGTLDIEWRKADNHVYMTGPAAFVYDGETDLPE
jgi:diaminopimelate epimerase